MKKILILLKLCYKFSKKYFVGYFSALAKPILFGLLGILLLVIGTINTNLILLGLLSIPCTCYAFWKGYVITYGLIPCANNFMKDSADSFENYSKEAKENEINLAKYLCFVAILTILFYIPSILYILKTVPFSIDMLYDTQKLYEYANLIDRAFIINTLPLAPFLNYALCAFYFKKENEGYFKLFLNCY